MLDGITFVLFITCTKPQFFNECKEDWTTFDKQTIERAVNKCLTDEYYADAPCLKVFIKRNPGEYAAICGASERRDY